MTRDEIGPSALDRRNPCPNRFGEAEPANGKPRPTRPIQSVIKDRLVRRVNGGRLKRRRRCGRHCGPSSRTQIETNVAQFADHPHEIDWRLDELDREGRSEEHTSELQSLMRISYAVFCLKNKTNHTKQDSTK